MLPLLAQLVAPPLQPGPVRLPDSEVPELRERERQAPLRIEPAPAETGPSPLTPEEEGAPGGPAGLRGATPYPPVRGLTVYGTGRLRRILSGCSSVPDPVERLRACGEALGRALAADGYLNTRVYVRELPSPGLLEVVEGRIEELRVEGGSPWLNARVSRLMAPQRGRILRVPRLQKDLQQLGRVSGGGMVRAELTRLGSDPTRAVLSLSLPGGRPRWRGEVSVSNDGNDASGEYRGDITLLKPALLRWGDTLLIYGELNASGEAGRPGTGIGSISYTLPLTDSLSLTGAFGYTRRNLVELTDPLDGFATSQYQALGQLEWVVHESLGQRWSLYAGYSGNRTNAFLDDAPLPRLVPQTVREPTSGYLRVGVSGRGVAERFAWSGTGYLLQGVAAATPAGQRRELEVAGIEPGRATALGGLLSASWAFAPRWQIQLRTGGQVAFNPLTNPMRFVLGSDVGLRGLPAQLVSGDDGWLATAETVWTFWRGRRSALQLVPFIGAGWVRTEFPQLTFSDTIGAGGAFVRWLQGNSLEAELGWVSQFSEDDNPGTWTDWNLAEGIYGKLTYRF